jgi:hypothetical protein
MRRSLLALPLLLALVACSDDDENASPVLPVTPVASIAVIQNTSVPTIVAAVPASDPSFDWQVSWSVRAEELAGVSARIELLQVTIADQQVLHLSGSQVATLVGSNTIGSKGSLSIPLSLQYSLPAGGRAANVTTTLTCVDAHNNTIVNSSQIRILE